MVLFSLISDFLTGEGFLSLPSNGFIAFFAFGCCASSVYLLNDLFDLDDDRRHRSKCKRPFASGDLTIINGVVFKFVFLCVCQRHDDVKSWVGVKVYAEGMAMPKAWLCQRCKGF